MTTKHILIADDEKQMLQTLEFILEVARFRVSLAANANEALRLIDIAHKTRHPVDLVITDIQMPGGSGLELLRQLQALYPELPVLVITGHGNREIIKVIRQQGCNEILEKPVEEAQLLKCIERLATKKKKPEIYMKGVASKMRSEAQVIPARTSLQTAPFHFDEKSGDLPLRRSENIVARAISFRCNNFHDKRLRIQESAPYGAL